MKLLASSAIALALAAAPAMAFQFTGGNAELSYSAFADDMDYSKAGLSGQFGFAFGPQLGAQIDVGVSKFFEVGETAHDLTLHGIYNVAPEVAMGVFYGAERIAGNSRDFYGFELTQKSQMFEGELYLGRGESVRYDGMLAGISGSYNVAPEFGLGLAYDRADIRGLDMRKYAITAEYAISPDISLGAEVGRFKADLDEVHGSETYVGLNAKMYFGGGDATFSRRGVLDIIPGL